MSPNSSPLVSPLQEALVAERLRRVLALPLVASVLARLRSELSPRFVYHSIDHTLSVIEEAVRFATLDLRSERDCLLVGIAAAFHDAGFLLDHTQHELLGATMCREALVADGGFSADEVAMVERMILDTRLEFTDQTIHQDPSTPLSGYLLDADLANLGREDFFPSIDRVREELAHLDAGPGYDPVRLLELHDWHSRPARSLRDHQKQLNRKALSERRGER